MTVRFGPAGLGGVNEAIKNLETYRGLGLRACEIAFTYGVYIKNKDDAIKIGKKAKELGIKLSIHAPYYINLNSDDEKKVEASKQRILKCLETGTWLNAQVVVFHPGYYGKKEAKESFEKIKDAIIEIQQEAKSKGYTPKLAPETMGKVNVFGSVDDISRLVSDTECKFCLDFAHILARYKEYNFKEVFKKFKEHKKIHIHFSGIEYGEKGERHHKKTEPESWKKLIDNLPENKDITIINESPFPVEDSVAGLEVYSKRAENKHN
jgi:deoxyribonuclease-4